MCILCSVQKWARGVAMMLPWFVIPLIGLWALSQLLPPPFRFEITSPRLACVIVLLVTLFWYEFLMPQLSTWRVRRNARLREMRRSEAIELQKLKKTATRRCRNCLTPYKEQNPGGGRFMCAYCGHLSKRPVLDLPIPPVMSNLSPEILKDLAGKSGNILNSRVWSDNGWICNGQDNLENANWIGDSLHVKSLYWRNSEGVVCRLNESCMTEKSYSHVIVSTCKLLRSSLSSARWLWRKIMGLGSPDDDISVNGEHVRKLATRDENGINLQESKSDKARRKAEEKRQARLEKEQLEEEERKQREEVARLVEERRKIRDETEKDRFKSSGPVKERQKKDAEKKRQEKTKERDRGSCKSNSDAEDLERKVMENDRKREPERKFDSDRRESQRSGMDNGKGYNMEPGQSKGVTATYSKANTGAKYLDRVRGTFLSSSNTFSRGSLFGMRASNHTTVLKENRSNAFMDRSQTHANRKDSSHSDHATGSASWNGDDRHIYKPALPNPSSTAAPKKSWGQLFSCSTTAVPSSTSNVISRPHTKDPSDIQRPVPGQPLPAQSFDNPLDFGLPSPFTLSSFPNLSINTSSGFHSATEYVSTLSGGSPQKLLPEEPELFEDPCYVPDPVSLLGPVSESLDNFQLDLGTGFGTSNIYGKSFGLNNVSAPCEVVRPSPIESPLSRLRVNDDRHTNLRWDANSQKAQNMHDACIADTFNNSKDGTWQMWSSSPLVEDGMIAGSLNWRLSEDSTKEGNVHQLSCQSTGLLFSNRHPVVSRTNSPVKAISRNSQSGGDVASPFFSPVGHDPWLEKTFSPPLSDSDNHSVHNVQNEVNQNDVTFDSPKKSANSSPLDHSPVNSLSKNQWAAYQSGEGFSSSSTTASVKLPVGGLYSTPNVQSLWSV
ncbi:unnamed protein product [Rhodiola kirilowii]